jgi:osmotically-inducible protein OsmY
MLTRERSRRAAALTLVLVVTLFTAGFAAKCNRDKNRGGANTNNANSPETTQEVERAVDNMLLVKVRQNLTEQSANSNTGLSALDIEIGVLKRKVTLRGTVRSEAARDAASRIARATEVERNGEMFKVSDVDATGLTVRTPSP